MFWVLLSRLLSRLFQNTPPQPPSNLSKEFAGKEGANEFILHRTIPAIQSTLQFLPLGREAVRSGKVRIKDESWSCDKRTFLR